MKENEAFWWLVLIKFREISRYVPPHLTVMYLSEDLLQLVLSMEKLRKPYETKGFSTLSLFDRLQSFSDCLQGLRKSLGDLRKISKT